MGAFTLKSHPLVNFSFLQKPVAIQLAISLCYLLPSANKKLSELARMECTPFALFLISAKAFPQRWILCYWKNEQIAVV